MEKHFPQWLSRLYHQITNYEQEIADPVERIKVEMHVKTLFAVFLALNVGGFLNILCLNANTTTCSAYILLLTVQIYCAISLIRLYCKKYRHLGTILSIFIMVTLFLGTNYDETLTFCGLVFAIIMPNFIQFLTQSNRMAFFGFLCSILLNVVSGPKFYELVFRESGSQYLANLLDAGRATFNVYTLYAFAFSALGDSRSNKILSTLSETLKAEENIKQEKDLLAAKNLFFSCFSHEMRNPLNCILGSMDYAIKYATDDAICDILSTGKACGSLLLNLINNILDMGKLDSNNIALNEDMRDSKQFITNIWKVTQELFKKKKQQGEFFVDRDFPPMIHIDDTRLSQVIVNLISNACKFTAEGKNVRIIFSFERIVLGSQTKSRPPTLELSQMIRHFEPNEVIKPGKGSFKRLQKQSNFTSIYEDNSPRWITSIEDDHIEKSYLDKLVDNRSKKTLHHVKAKSQTQAPLTSHNRYILLFSTEGSLKSLVEWNPMANSNKLTARQKGTIKIEVTDSGCGMTNEEIGKLFKPFTQANKSITGTYGGTGLGLYITQSLINLMKGTVTVKSERNVGSSFTISIPNEPTSSIETSPNNRHLRSQSPFSRFQIIVCSNMSENKVLLCDFVEKMKNNYYNIEQVDHFLLPHAYEKSLTYLKTYFVYEASSITTENIQGLNNSDFKDYENSVFLFGSNTSQAQLQSLLPFSPSITLASDCEVLANTIHNHTKELLTTIKSKHSILIVDDDDFNRRIFSVFLAREGYNVYTAQNGQEGYEVFCEHANDIHMVVVDYEMPICDGPTCAEKILKYVKNQNMTPVPIHALTGNVSQESKTRIARAGIRKAWNKPAKLEEIIDEIFYIVVK